MRKKIVLWWKFKQKIKTPRLILRQFSPKDIPAVRSFANNPTVLQYLLWETITDLYFSGDNIPAYCKPKCGVYAIVQQKSSLCIGSIEVNLDNKTNSCSFFYMLDPKYWHKGYAVEALRAVINFCFDDLRLMNASATYFAENAVSGQVMQKSGMLFNKTVKDEVFMRGAWRTVIYYSLSRTQWEQSK